MNYIYKSAKKLIVIIGLVACGMCHTIQAETFILWSNSAVYENMDSSGGQFGSYFNSGYSPTGDYFYWQPTVSSITSLNPGTNYVWDYYSPPNGITSGISMILPLNIYSNLPAINQTPKSIIINGVDMQDDPYQWMIEQVTAGNLVPIMEYTVTLPDLPSHIVFNNWEGRISRSGGASYSGGLVDRYIGILYYDSDGNILYPTSEILPGDVLLMRPIVLGGPMSTTPPYGSAFGFDASLDVVAIPEPRLAATIAPALLLLGHFMKFGLRRKPAHY